MTQGKKISWAIKLFKKKPTPWLKCIEVVYGQALKFVPGLSCGSVVQWLRLHSPNAGGPGSIPGQGTRSHMPQLKIPHAATKTWCSHIFIYRLVQFHLSPLLTSVHCFSLSEPYPGCAICLCTPISFHVLFFFLSLPVLSIPSEHCDSFQLKALSP